MIKSNFLIAEFSQNHVGFQIGQHSAAQTLVPAVEVKPAGPSKPVAGVALFAIVCLCGSVTDVPPAHYLPALLVSLSFCSVSILSYDYFHVPVRFLQEFVGVHHTFLKVYTF